MGLVDQIYQYLRNDKTPQADRVLRAAMADAEPEYFDRMVGCLLVRKTPSACAALIAHYERLEPETRKTLRSRGDPYYDALAAVMSTGTPDERLCALTAFLDDPAPRLADVLQEGLRDRTPAVRERSALALRTVADVFLSEGTEPATGRAGARPTARRQEEQQLVATLRESLLSLDTHLRVEILEPCLWFCKQIGDPFWQAIYRSRSRCARVLIERLASWNSSRLADFLLREQSHTELRRIMQKTLAAWGTPDEISELLRRSTRLADPETRRSLLGVRNPKWFRNLGKYLEALPRELRREAPAWVCAAGYTERERIALLRRWTEAADIELSRAATRCLEKLEAKDARPSFKPLSPNRRNRSAVATGGDYALRRAHSTDALQINPTTDSYAAAQRPVSRTPRPPPPGSGTPDTEFVMLWQLSRRTPSSQRGPLVKILLEHINSWSHGLTGFLRSPDPRDRALATEMIGAAGLVDAHRGHLIELLSDQDADVRQAASTALNPAPKATGDTAEKRGAPERVAAGAVVEQARSTCADPRRKIRTVLRALMLMDSVGNEEAHALVRELRALLHEVSSETPRRSSHEAESGAELLR